MTAVPCVIVDTTSTPPGLIVWQGVTVNPESRLEAGQALYTLTEYAGLINPDVIRIDPTTHGWEPVGVDPITPPGADAVPAEV